MDKALAPGFARTTYDGDSGIHHHITPLNIVGTPVPGADPTVQLKDTTTTSAETAMRDYWTNVGELLASDQHVGLCEIYAVDPDTGEGTFLWGFDVNIEGGSGAGGVAMSQMTLSFKLVNGRVYKLVLLDTPAAPNQKDYAPYLVGGNVEAVATYIVSGDSPVYGRGNAYPFASIAFTTKTSDALRSREGLG